LLAAVLLLLPQTVESTVDLAFPDEFRVRNLTLLGLASITCAMIYLSTSMLPQRTPLLSYSQVLIILGAAIAIVPFSYWITEGYRQVLFLDRYILLGIVGAIFPAVVLADMLVFMRRNANGKESEGKVSCSRLFLLYLIGLALYSAIIFVLQSSLHLRALDIWGPFSFWETMGESWLRDFFSVVLPVASIMNLVLTSVLLESTPYLWQKTARVTMAGILVALSFRAYEIVTSHYGT
jgi:hypothetical protein